MRWMMALALLVGANMAATPALAAPGYTDHYGAWTFTGPGLASVAEAPGQFSVLLRLKDGSGFTAFVPVVPLELRGVLGYQAYRPPLMYFECYSNFQTGNLFIRGQQTQIAGSCTQALENVGGTMKYVVRFAGYQFPVQGFGVYSVCPAPGSC